MGSGQAYRTADNAAPYLEQGERVGMTAFVTIGPVSVPWELVRTLAAGAAAAVASDGTSMYRSMRRPRKAYLAVTTYRLMFFNGEGVFGHPGVFLFILPKQAVEITWSGRFGLGLLRMELAVAGQDQGLRVDFAPGSREVGDQLVASLEAAQRARSPRRETGEGRRTWPWG